MPIVTHHIPVTTGQAHHMTLRLVQPYGAPVPNGQYMIEGSILQDDMPVPISSAQSTSSGFLLTIPPLYPGHHPYSLQIRNKTTDATYTILQGHCQVSELIDHDPLDNTAVEQITVTLKEDLTYVVVTVQIAPDITAAALNAVASASGIIADIRKTAELETNKAVAAIDQTGTTACASVQAAATAGQTAIQTAQATATASVETAKDNALSSIASAVDAGKNAIQTAQSTATDAIAAAKNNALLAIEDAVEAGQAQFAASIEAILSDTTLIARLKTACGIPALETAMANKADTTALNAYIPYAKIGRALTKAADGKVDVDLSNYTGATVNITGTTSACIGRGTTQRLEVFADVARIIHSANSEIVSGRCYVSTSPNGFTIDSDYSNATHAYISGSTYGIDIKGNQEITIRSYSGNYPGIFVCGKESRVKICKWTTTSYNELASFGDNAASISYYTTFYGGHN